MIVHPVRDDAPRGPSTIEWHRSGQTSVANLSDVHVLAVDDEADALSLVSDVLQAAGARVTHGALGGRGVGRASMPKCLMSSSPIWEWRTWMASSSSSRVRRHQNPRVREIPAAALTAYARVEDRMKALRAGFQIHLAKPIDPAELVTTIAALAKRFVTRSPDDLSDSCPVAIRLRARINR